MTMAPTTTSPTAAATRTPPAAATTRTSAGTHGSSSIPTLAMIPCCVCGTKIIPNAANQCSTCLAQQFNLREMIQGGGNSSGSGTSGGEPNLVIHQCRQCRRYARTPTHYEYCEPESPQLLSICLKHIPVLIKRGHSSNKLKIKDAMFIWTEPNSMRLKVRVHVEMTVVEAGGVIIEQRVPVEFLVQWKMCDACDREYTNRTWHAVVQLRQKRDDTGRTSSSSSSSSSSSPRKGLVALEMALRRSKDIRKNVLKIDTSRHGLDFYFLTLPQAQHFSQFLQRLAPMKISTTSKLVSTDSRNNTANMKYTLSCDMVPLCTDDLVLIHKSSRTALQGRVGLVTKVASVIHMIDASPNRSKSNKSGSTHNPHSALTTMELTADGYHKGGGAEKGFTVLQTPDRMTRFVVLDVEQIHHDDHHHSEDEDEDDNNDNGRTSKYVLADVQVARESDLGANDEVLNCVTHLGRLLKPGDVVWGYDLMSSRESLTTTATGSSSRGGGGGGGRSSSSSSAATTGGVLALEDVVNNNVVLQDVVLVKKISAKEQRELDDAADAALERDNTRTPTTATDSDMVEGVNSTKRKNKRSSKKKQRRQQKQDRKQRELEESAQRMGFLDDLDEQRAAYGGLDMINDDEVEENAADVDYYAVELEQVERELALAFPANNDIPSIEEED